jgi:FAD/FMN-containing dehydrogenase
MKRMAVDAERRIAWAQPGLTWGEYAARAQEYGLATPAGDSATVGVSGLALGGGIGWLVRKHGLTIDNLHSVEIVTADGRLAAEAEAVLVARDKATGRGRPLSERERAALERA